MELRLASRNPGKIRELEALLAPHGFVVRGIDDLAHLALVEDGDSFAQNALIKAREVMQASGEPTLADDSGLEVTALGGAPGIHSARFSGSEGPDVDAKNRAHLLERLRDVPLEERAARFVCVLAYCVPGEAPRYFRGELRGRIRFDERGAGGFGYDRLFELPERGVTLAELAAEEKNALSHRGRALAAFVADLTARSR